MFNFDFEYKGDRYTFKIEFINGEVHTELFKYIVYNEGNPSKTISRLKRVSVFKNTNKI